jgi:hypothetical protein
MAGRMERPHYRRRPAPSPPIGRVVIYLVLIVRRGHRLPAAVMVLNGFKSNAEPSAIRGAALDLAVG